MWLGKVAGFDLLRDGHHQAGSALDAQLVGTLPANFGHAVVEPALFAAFSARGLPDCILRLLRAQPNETVSLLIVYQYEGNDPRIVTGVQAYAASSGEFRYGATGRTGPRSFQMTIIYDFGE